MHMGFVQTRVAPVTANDRQQFSIDRHVSCYARPQKSDRSANRQQPTALRSILQIEPTTHTVTMYATTTTNCDDATFLSSVASLTDGDVAWHLSTKGDVAFQKTSTDEYRSLLHVVRPCADTRFAVVWMRVMEIETKNAFDSKTLTLVC